MSVSRYALKKIRKTGKTAGHSRFRYTLVRILDGSVCAFFGVMFLNIKGSMSQHPRPARSLLPTIRHTANISQEAGTKLVQTASRVTWEK